MLMKFRRYIGHESGVAAIIFALTLPAIIAALGVGVDLAAAYNAKNRLGNALDKAVLAVASTTGTTQQLQDQLTAFFNANYPAGKYGTPISVTLTVSGSVMTADASASVPTTFMSIFGVPSMTIAAESQVVRSLAGIEAVLVLDVTGSMAGNNITALKTASTNFLNTMFSKITDTKYIKIGIVPWSDAVNVGPYGVGLTPTGGTYGTPFVSPPATDPYVSPASSITWGAGVNDWHGCVIERDSTTALTDDPAPPNWTMYRYPPGQCAEYNCLQYSCAQYNCAQYNCATCSSGKTFKGVCSTKGATCTSYSTTCHTYGTTCVQQGTSCLQRGTTCIQYSGNPNTNCPTVSILPMTNDQTALQNEINSLPTQGNTYSNIGMVWGWRVISPGFPFTEAAPYDDPNWSKTVILMTDGNNTINTVLSGEGPYGTPGTSMTTTDQNNKFEQVCTNMKAMGIRVYTITFQSVINATTKQFYKDCATNSTMYYDAPSNQDLIDAFATIANQLSQLHLTK